MPTATAASPYLRPFRLGVGCVVFNAQGKVFLAERADTPGAWQFPQGGIDADEAARPDLAVLREALEELGTDKFMIIAVMPDMVDYVFPDALMETGKAFNNKYCGQKQWWFALMFTGRDEDIQLVNPHEKEKAEFSRWRWGELSEATNLIVDFKRPAYEKIVAYFQPLAQNLAHGAPLPKFNSPWPRPAL